MRAGLFQSGFGVIFPCVLAPLSSFMFATRHFTYRLPSITAEPMQLFRLWRKFTNPIINTIFGLVCINFLVAGFLTYKEMESFYGIQLKLHQLEEKFENE